jgi:hypothetical protein
MVVGIYSEQLVGFGLSDQHVYFLYEIPEDNCGQMWYLGASVSGQATA